MSIIKSYHIYERSIIMTEISAVQGSNNVVRTTTLTQVEAKSQNITFEGRACVATDVENMEKLLNKYGLKQLAREVEWNHLSKVEVKIDSKGQEMLCITSNNNFALEIPINESYNPQNVVITSGEGVLDLENLNGTLRLENNANSYVQQVNLTNCKVTVYGNDEQSDSIAAYGKNDITYITNDFSDTLLVPGVDEDGYYDPELKNIPRGTSTFNIEG